jgi:hypothetical protein
MGVDVIGVHLIGVYLIGVHLTGVHLINVGVIGVYLTGVCLIGVHASSIAEIINCECKMTAEYDCPESFRNFRARRAKLVGRVLGAWLFWFTQKDGNIWARD